MPGGRPTNDPKGTLIAVRLSDRQVRVLEARAKRDGVPLSEALRRCVDEWAATCRRSSAAPRAHAPNKEERETFEQAFAALGMTYPRRRRRPRRG